MKILIIYIIIYITIYIIIYFTIVSSAIKIIKHTQIK